MKSIKLIVMLIAFCACIPSLFSQATAQPPAPVKTGIDLPRGIASIELGMALDTVKKLLSETSLFYFQGDPDVSLLPRENQVLIETAGFSFVKRAWFQFYEEKLFTIILSLNTEKIDYYTMFTKFSGSYGQPEELDPKQSVWMNGETRLSLEKPLSVKYLDVKTLQGIREKVQTGKALEDISRESFLDLFGPKTK